MVLVCYECNWFYKKIFEISAFFMNFIIYNFALFRYNGIDK